MRNEKYTKAIHIILVGDKMADIREDGWEWFHYDNPDFQVQFRRNFIPAGVTISDIRSIHGIKMSLTTLLKWSDFVGMNVVI